MPKYQYLLHPVIVSSLTMCLYLLIIIAAYTTELRIDANGHTAAIATCLKWEQTLLWDVVLYVGEVSTLIPYLIYCCKKIVECCPFFPEERRFVIHEPGYVMPLLIFDSMFRWSCKTKYNVGNRYFLHGHFALIALLYDVIIMTMKYCFDIQEREVLDTIDTSLSVRLQKNHFNS
jgi:hypothetical protein